MTRWSLLLALTLLASATFASGEYMDVFLSNYKLNEDAAFGDKSCGICHVSDSDFAFNPYGKDMRKALTDVGATDLDSALLVSLEGLDSDGDGTLNGMEIEGRTFPGDPTSGGDPGTVTPTADAAPEKKASRFPPKNAFHPAIVHFPIALFIGGLILDFLGMLRKNKTLLAAGWYCIVMAAIASVGAIISGVGAMALLKLPYRGLIFDHLTFAIGSAVVMWIMVALRVDRHENMNVRLRIAYYFLAVACLLMISWAGHLGGVFVYGE
ncbi:MAG: DUF2231 domain-containing protein [Fimbriimonadaceae bacterium]